MRTSGLASKIPAVPRKTRHWPRRRNDVYVGPDKDAVSQAYRDWEQSVARGDEEWLEHLRDESVPGAREPDRPRRNIVYFIQAGPDGPVKIGYSTRQSFHSRLGVLRCDNATELYVLRIVRGALKLERRLHSHFDDERLRKRGEWFAPSERLLRLATSTEFAKVSAEEVLSSSELLADLRP